jgi:hypothetical protein
MIPAVVDLLVHLANRHVLITPCMLLEDPEFKFSLREKDPRYT